MEAAASAQQNNQTVQHELWLHKYAAHVQKL
jgi:hypothetical protein